MGFLSGIFGTKISSLKDGPFTTYYSNGQVDKKGTKKNGKLDGPYEWWQSKGQLNVKCFYVRGIEHGPYREYLPNGQLFKDGRYNMGEKCGEWVEGGGVRTYPPCPPDLTEE